MDLNKSQPMIRKKFSKRARLSQRNLGVSCNHSDCIFKSNHRKKKEFDTINKESNIKKMTKDTDESEKFSNPVSLNPCVENHECLSLLETQQSENKKIMIEETDEIQNRAYIKSGKSFKHNLRILQCEPDEKNLDPTQINNYVSETTDYINNYDSYCESAMSVSNESYFENTVGSYIGKAHSGCIPDQINDSSSSTPHKYTDYTQRLHNLLLFHFDDFANEKE